jgi:hypothetical protein
MHAGNGDQPNPILVGAGNDVVSGHALVLAARQVARQVGMEEVPFIDLRGCLHESLDTAK